MAANVDDLRIRKPYNAAAEFIEANIDRGLEGKIAFTDQARSITYGELLTATCRFASGLRALGLRQETRIALLLLDSVDFPVAFWGAIRAGMIPIPRTTLLSSDQFLHLFEDSRAEAVVISGQLLPTIEPILSRLSFLRVAIIAGGDGSPPAAGSLEVHRLEDVLASGAPDRFTAPTVSDEVAFWLYSSGSTGEPKGVKHVHTSLMATARLFGQATLGIQADDVIFSAAKLAFAYGLGNGMSFPMSVGASVALLSDRATPDAVLAMMRLHRPTVFFGVPTLYTSLLAHEKLGRGMGSDRLRLCVSAGEALPAAIGERWRDVVGVDILDGIGSTEMLNTFISNRPGDVRYGTSGRPVTGYEAKIVGPDGAELGDGEIGELAVRGPSAAEGYWNRRAKNRATFVGEWTHTGDEYIREADGSYRYCGRVDEMFKVSAYWVSPFDVEAALVSHEAVLEAAVIGSEDNDGLVKPKAFIVLKNGYTPDELLFESLKACVKRKAGGWTCPRWFDVRSELPKTATGKIQRYKLREEDRRHAAGI